MHSVRLRKVGGSVMLAVPPAALELLDMKAGSSVGVAVEDGRLVVAPTQRARYTLDELLAQCDPNKTRAAEDDAWLEAPPRGAELI